MSFGNSPKFYNDREELNRRFYAILDTIAFIARKLPLNIIGGALNAPWGIRAFLIL